MSKSISLGAISLCFTPLNAITASRRRESDESSKLTVGTISFQY